MPTTVQYEKKKKKKKAVVWRPLRGVQYIYLLFTSLIFGPCFFQFFTFGFYENYHQGYHDNY